MLTVGFRISRKFAVNVRFGDILNFSVVRLVVILPVQLVNPKPDPALALIA